MTQKAFSGHCERFEKSRGNLKTLLLDLFNKPESGNPGKTQGLDSGSSPE